MEPWMRKAAETQPLRQDCVARPEGLCCVLGQLVVLLLCVGCNGGTDPKVPETKDQSVSWAKDPPGSTVSANKNGTWERIDDKSLKTPPQIVIENGALQDVGRNHMDPGSLLRAYGHHPASPIQLYVNHWSSAIGTYAISWDLLARGASMLQYAIRAAVTPDGKLLVVFTQNFRKTSKDPRTELSWTWVCRRLR